MKFVAVSQRVDIAGYNIERSDAIDQQWMTLLLKCGLVPVLIPNNTKLARELLKSFFWNGVLLTGGNDLCKYGGNTPERDETELLLIEYAIYKKLPLLGVCRGMQIIQHYFGVKLHTVKDHVRKKHHLTYLGVTREVNSYHHLGATSSVCELDIVAKAKDGVIEAISHKKYPIHGIMWHPERNKPFNEEDKKLVKQLFKL